MGTADHSAIFWISIPGASADYSPTNSDGFTSGTATVSAGLTGSLASISWSYNIPYVKIEDPSNSSVNRAGWVHDFNEKSLIGTIDPTLMQRLHLARNCLENIWLSRSLIEEQY